MLTHKHIDRTILILMALAVLLCILAMGFSSQLAAAGDTGVTMQYESKLFDTSEPLEVNILMEETDWEEMLTNATQETYYQCDVEINGETFYSVGIRPKGNTSLTTIAADADTDRYSLKLEFDHYIEDQTCYGLDKLILNNNYADATNMKEALIYDMFQYLGADASLYNYASISVNGEYWGVYLALEGVEDSFLLRNYGVESGELYKPESMGMGEDAAGGGMSMDSGGADLSYTDDELDSYSTIWDGEITSTSDADRQRVVTALKNISEGADLEAYMDIDNLLRYAAVHMFSVNEDSLSGVMSHNYYLYEYNGMLNLLPWDYNLSLGGMNGTNATDMVNDPVDDIFSGTTFFDALMENEEYLETYHGYLRQLVEEYVDGGAFDEFYERTRSQIDSLAEADPTAFYSYEEYQTAAETFYEAVKLRGESVLGQVDGEIPSTSSGQKEDSSALVDASNIELSAMGTMSTGGGDAGGFGGGDLPANFSAEDLPENFSADDLPENFSADDLPENFSTDDLPENFSAEDLPANFSAEDFDPSDVDVSSLPDNTGSASIPANAGGMPQGFDGSGADAQTASDNGNAQAASDNAQTAADSASGTITSGSKAAEGAAPENEIPESETSKNEILESGSLKNETSESETSESTASESKTSEETISESETSESTAAQGNFAGGNDPGGQPGQGGGGDFGNFDPESLSEFSGFSGFSDTSSTDQTANVTENLIVWGVCLAILLAALLFAVLFRRKPRRR